MTVRYHTRKGTQCPEYVCQSEGIDNAMAKCQTIPGSGIDQAIGEILVETVTPITLEVALQVQAELEARAQETDDLRRQRVDRAHHEADLARRRFMGADPSNRLVVDVLEAEWNKKLRALNDAQEELEQRRAKDQQALARLYRLWILKTRPMRHDACSFSSAPQQHASPWTDWPRVVYDLRYPITHGRSPWCEFVFWWCLVSREFSLQDAKLR